MIITKTGDTCAVINQDQFTRLNHIYLENVMYREIIDSLLVNDSLKTIKESHYIRTIELRDHLISNLEKMIKNSQQIIAIKDREIKDIHRKNRMYKLIMIGEALVVTAILIIK